MTAFADRTDAERLQIMEACTASGSEFHHRTAAGFRVAIGRRRLGDTMAAMAPHGFMCQSLHTFPLGTDRPPEHLRHDAPSVPACNWLFADFE
jgi:hypothetical protein